MDSGRFGTEKEPSGDKIKGAMLRNILVSILILCVMFLVENKTYLFDYLPFSSDYQITEATIQPSPLKFNRAKVTVSEGGVAVCEAVVKHGFTERVWDEIPVGYSAASTPHVVRVAPVVTWGALGIAAALILGNIGIAVRLKKAAGDP
jgi:hypothetical protein